MTNEDWGNPECRTVMRLSEHLDPDGSKNVTLMLVHGSEREEPVTLPVGLGYDNYELLWNSAYELPPTDILKVNIAKPITVSGSSVLLLCAI